MDLNSQWERSKFHTSGGSVKDYDYLAFLLRFASAIPDLPILLGPLGWLHDARAACMRSVACSVSKIFDERVVASTLHSYHNLDLDKFCTRYKTFKVREVVWCVHDVISLLRLYPLIIMTRIAHTKRLSFTNCTCVCIWY